MMMRPMLGNHFSHKICIIAMHSNDKCLNRQDGIISITYVQWTGQERVYCSEVTGEGRKDRRKQGRK